MSSRLIEIFDDDELVEKIKRRLPYLFQLAELESSRAGLEKVKEIHRRKMDLIERKKEIGITT